MKKPLPRSLDWIATILILILLILASSRLGLTKWADHLDVVGWLLFFGAILGFALGRWRTHWLVLTPISIVLSALLFALTFVFMLSEMAGFVAKVIDVWTRINVTTAQLIANQPVTDSILFLLIVGVIFWSIGVTTGLFMVRSANPWIPLILLGIGVLAIEHYQPDPRRAFYSWAYALVCIVLLGRLFFIKLRQEITNTDNNIGSDTEFDFNRGILVTAIVIGFIVLIAPRLVHLLVPASTEQTRFTQRWQVFTSNFENVFFSLDQTQLTQEQQIAEDFSLGTGQIQGKEPVLYIQTSSNTIDTFPFYWRGKVYSTYSDKTWSMGNTYKQSYSPLQKINSQQPAESRVRLKVWVQSQLPELSQIYTTGEVVNFSRRVDAAVATETIYEKEILGYFIDPPLNDQEIYRFEALVSIPNTDQLETAGTAYPNWVVERYLQLPEGISERMRALSGQIVGENTTPYDIAKVITQFLRTNYEYQSVIPAPPKKTDPVEWFLFDYKKGFCNYYASAEVLLLRIAGVPARLAVGYAQGSPAGSGEGITVQRDDSHAWPEVYFPGYGWIPFEPTASLPSLEWASSGNLSTSNAGNPDLSLEEPSSRDTSGLTGEDRANILLEQMDAGLSDKQPLSRKLSVFGYILVGLASVLGTAGLIYISLKLAKNRQAARESIITAINNIRKWIYRIPVLGYWLKTLGFPLVQRNFSSIEFSLRLLGEEVGPGSTALELSAALQKRLPAIEKEISQLISQYQLFAYSNHSSQTNEGKQAAKTILKSAAREWWDIRYQRIERFLDRFG
jgi:transglutaminase-like putative cysteine protease